VDVPWLAEVDEGTGLADDLARGLDDVVPLQLAEPLLRVLGANPNRSTGGRCGP